jgi:Leucine-rich repeat (LRR) protein
MEINEEKLLIEFNNKYKSKLSLDSKKIDVLSCNILDRGLCELCSFNFNPNVEKLILEDNIISNLSPLVGISFGKKLISLDLSSNKISSIDILSKVNFPLLNHLYLNDNYISNITCISDFKFPNLIELNLSSNKISSIDSLLKANFYNLKELLLSKNEISSIDILSEVNFTKIKILTLDNNKISSIECLSKIKFQKIREIRLEKNKIKNINILRKVTLPKLSYLSLGDDILGDNLNELKEMNVPNLEDIFIYANDKIIKNKSIQNIVEFFENKGVLFNFIKYDKNGNQILDRDINFMNNYDDDDDEDEEDINNINIDKKKDDNFNDFLLKEGLL